MRRAFGFDYSTAPNAQMSARLSTTLPRACSGLMYPAVPRIIPACVACNDNVGDMDSPGDIVPVGSIAFASPKSSTFTYTFLMNAQAYVHQADVMLAEGTDPATVGAMVTVALCGHWEHDGPCRWPHHNQIEGRQFRTVFIATAEDEPEVRRRIRTALHGQPGWRVLSDAGRTLAADEQEVAARLAQAPRRL